MRLTVFGCVLFMAAFACSPKHHIRKEVVRLEKELKDHTGFLLFDPVSKKNLIEHQSDRYYTPASNTKIFTFYTALKILGDSALAVKYIHKGDSLIFWGTGDASFLYANVFDNRRLFDFLNNTPGKLFLSTSNFQTETLGPGWAYQRGQTLPRHNCHHEKGREGCRGDRRYRTHICPWQHRGDSLLMPEFLQLAAGTVSMRPYVFAFFAAYLLAAVPHMGWKRVAIFTLLGYLTAFASEFSSINSGFPYGWYYYLDKTSNRELWIAGVPFLTLYPTSFSVTAATEQPYSFSPP